MAVSLNIFILCKKTHGGKKVNDRWFQRECFNGKSFPHDNDS